MKKLHNKVYSPPFFEKSYPSLFAFVKHITVLFGVSSISNSFRGRLLLLIIGACTQ